MPICAIQIIAMESVSPARKAQIGNHQAHRRHVAVGGVVDDGPWLQPPRDRPQNQIGRQKQDA